MKNIIYFTFLCLSVVSYAQSGRTNPNLKNPSSTNQSTENPSTEKVLTEEEIASGKSQQVEQNFVNEKQEKVK